MIWALTGAGYPWPLWVAGPLGAILLGRWITGGPADDSGSRREPRGGHDQIGGNTPDP